ncbi:universal stress protein [Pseudovibrio sp. SPO723]|uniref:universal stress protein n=1 Tax=Nesiotobacter zosterae TaxID=392721 RepID=UPI0029C5CDD2|nr:universal stress protein [Pseudovibrio sp. SPO723]MDX5594082.1 universal stress protein [Pseudovibrio sp. SPO723]
MFKKIMVPVDLAHQEILDKALDVSGKLAKTYNAKVLYVGVTEATPTAVAHNPAEFQHKLEAFAAKQADLHGIETEPRTFASHDPATDLNETLVEASVKLGADLIVIASHVPTFADRFWASHGGTVASRANISVMVIR